MARVIVVTPWLGKQDELMPDYARAVERVNVVVAVDNDPGKYEWPDSYRVAYGDPQWSFAQSNNEGTNWFADQPDDIVVFLNSDVAGDPGWVEQAKDEVKPGYLYGQTLVCTNQVCEPVSREMAPVPGGDVVYLEGWCLAAKAGTWERIGWWPEWDGFYWEDVQVSLNAQRAGVPLRVTRWPIQHKVGRSSGGKPGIPRMFWQSHKRFVEGL